MGDDSPHAIGFPLGFVAGAALTVFLNKRFQWGRVATIVGAFLVVVSVVSSVIIWRNTIDAKGLAGFVWLIRIVLTLHGVMASLGLLFAGVFSTLSSRACSRGDAKVLRQQARIE